LRRKHYSWVITIFSWCEHIAIPIVDVVHYVYNGAPNIVILFGLNQPTTTP